MAEQELKLALAIQKPEIKSGVKNMGAETEDILRAGGLRWQISPRVDFARTNIPGLYIWYRKNGDLAGTAARGETPLIIVGRDKLKEYGGPNPPIVLKELEFSDCSLKIGVTLRNEFGDNRNREYREPKDLKDQTIFTNYPRGASRWLDQNDVPWVVTDGITPTPPGVARIIYIDGGAESVVNWGSAQACVEISRSGDSFTLNQMSTIDSVLKSQAVLAANPNLGKIKGSKAIVLPALRAIMTGLWQTSFTMLEINYPKAQEEMVLEGLPARESPTKSVLDNPKWGAAKVLIPKNEADAWVEKLYARGARDAVLEKVERVYPNLDDPEVTRMMRVIYGQDYEFIDSI